jgi:hypothetical protein
MEHHDCQAEGELSARPRTLHACEGRAFDPRLADGVRNLGHLLDHEVIADPGLPMIELSRAAVA